MMLPFIMLFGTHVLLRFLPLSFVHCIADIAGTVWYIFAKGRREIVKKNIEGLTGHVDKETVKNVFKNFMHIYVDLLNIPNLKGIELNSLVKKKNVKNLEQALSHGKGVILLTGHVGAWELAGPYLSYSGFPLYTVAESEGPGERFFRFYLRYREHFGTHVFKLEDKRLTLKLIKILKNGGVLALVSDRDITGTGRMVEFEGKFIRMPTGPVMLSWRTGSPLCVGMMVRERDGRYNGFILEPMFPEDFADLREMMEVVFHKLLNEIRRHPEQWFVFEEVWKNEDTLCE